jgi:hypothetical protein
MTDFNDPGSKLEAWGNLLSALGSLIMWALVLGVVLIGMKACSA